MQACLLSKFCFKGEVSLTLSLSFVRRVWMSLSIICYSSSLSKNTHEAQLRWAFTL